ncbi:hypothetical protein [Winogradskyella sp.]|nr:hypothetical protein [Winogradskyella sp.]MCT4630140.1 hypothetical protein [Winogradskyella sp.]
MKTKSNLPEPTLNENLLFSNFKSTMRVVSGVFKLTKKLFML